MSSTKHKQNDEDTVRVSLTTEQQGEMKLADCNKQIDLYLGNQHEEKQTQKADYISKEEEDVEMVINGSSTEEERSNKDGNMRHNSTIALAAKKLLLL